MKTKALILAVGMALAVQVSAAEIPWSHSLEASMKAARKARKILLVDFYASWSEPCRRMHKETFGDPRVVRKAKEFVAVQIDGEKEGRQTAREYGVRAYPETLFLDAKGKLIGRVAGLRPPEQMLEDMMRAKRASTDFAAYTLRVRKDRLNVEALSGLARIYAFRGEGDAATAMLSRAEKADPENAQGFLAGAFNAVGDFWQMSMQFDAAVPLFQKAAKLGKAPSQISYARASLAACLYSLGRNSEAIRELQAVLAMPNAPAKDKEDARKAIAEIQARGR